jgi:hypothetical protein
MASTHNPLCLARDGFAVVDTNPGHGAALAVLATTTGPKRQLTASFTGDLSRDSLTVLSLEAARDRAREAGWEVPPETDIRQSALN